MIILILIMITIIIVVVYYVFENERDRRLMEALASDFLRLEAQRDVLEAGIR